MVPKRLANMYCMEKEKQTLLKIFEIFILQLHFHCKEKGADAMHLSEQILNKVEHLKKELIPNEVHIAHTRNYGETASEKVSELLFHLFIAIIVVTLFVMLAMGWRGGLWFFICTSNFCINLICILFS
jgi:Cu/Ag efflux pump CusA